MCKRADEVFVLRYRISLSLLKSFATRKVVVKFFRRFRRCLVEND